MEELLRGASLHRRENHRRWDDGRGQVEGDGDDLGRHGNSRSRNKFIGREECVEPERQYGHKENHRRGNHGNHNDRNHGNRHHRNHGNHEDVYGVSHQVKDCTADRWPASHQEGCGGHLPRSQHQEALSPRQPQLCYTPASYIPLSDYVSVDEEELICFSPDGSTATATYSGPAHPCRGPSPLYEDDAPYTILSSLDTTEPVTAIFMGFQLTQDDSGHTPECEASLEAELVVIGSDSDDESDDTKETKNRPGRNGRQAGSSGGDRRAEKQAATGIRKIKRKHRPCCSVC